MHFLKKVLTLEAGHCLLQSSMLSLATTASLEEESRRLKTFVGTTRAIRVAHGLRATAVGHLTVSAETTPIALDRFQTHVSRNYPAPLKQAAVQLAAMQSYFFHPGALFRPKRRHGGTTKSVLKLIVNFTSKERIR